MKRFNVRQQQIISIIDEHTQPITGKKITSLLNISLRTLQQEVSNINAEIPLIASSNKGYQLNQSQLKKLSISVDTNSRDSHTILKKIILNDKYQIDELAESLFMSTSTLERKLKSYASLLSEHQLSLQREKTYIWIKGNELNKRKFINYLIFKEVNPTFHNIENISSYFQGIDISRIKIIILNAIHRYDYFVEKNYSSNLFINIIIALYRMRSDSYIESIPKHSIDENFNEYKIAKEICDQYANHWHISPTKSDIIYVAILLSGQIKPIDALNNSSFSSDFINKQFIEEINNILLEVFSYYMLDINYSDFIYNFAIHIDALIKRAKHNQSVNNDILENIKKNCPFIYDVAVLIAKKITEKYKIKINDAEIGYISIHIGFLIENSTEKNEKVNILLLTNDYHSITKNVEAKLNKKYSDLIEIETINDNNIEHSFHNHIDLIVSTKPLNILGKKNIIISPFYTMMDQLEVEKSITKCIEEKERNYQNKLLSLFFHEKLFFHIENEISKEDAIHFLGQKIVNFGLADYDFIESVKKREEMSSTCFFDTFAIPHAIDMNAKKTMFCVLINKDGIIWDNTKIHIILMIAVQQKDRKEFMKIYNGIIRSLWDKEKVQLLVEANSLVEFMYIIKKDI